MEFRITVRNGEEFGSSGYSVQGDETDVAKVVAHALETGKVSRIIITNITHNK